MMTSPFITLNRVSYQLADGRPLFSELSETFDHRHTGLVGRNGVGKTVLARILAGQLMPSSGHCVRSGSVGYLSQQALSPPILLSQALPSNVKSSSTPSVAQLMGIAPVLAALRRIEQGSIQPQDFEQVEARWDIEQRALWALSCYGLEGIELAQSAACLSGGQVMQVALAGALLSDADVLILDEPTNHLDQPARRALISTLEQWSRGLIVISHDRQLLNQMACIVELSSLGLQRYGGSYDGYVAHQAQAQQRAVDQLAQQRHEQRRLKRYLRLQQVRQARQKARGERQGQETNQAKVLLDGQKERSELTAGQRQKQHKKQWLEQSARVQQAALAVAKEAAIHLHQLGAYQQSRSTVTSRYVAVLEAVQLPFVTRSTKPLNLQVQAGQRIAVTGPNGCGKSTLLRLLAGQLQPHRGRCQVLGRVQMLDQSLASLDVERSVLSQLQQANPQLPDHEARMLLAQLDLGAQKVTQPSGLLSGGERLKAALACVLYAAQVADILLLDEPSNHLDLPSLAALESLLRDYPGTLWVVSHDQVFLQQLDLTDQLCLGDLGDNECRLTPWREEPDLMSSR